MKNNPTKNPENTIMKPQTAELMQPEEFPEMYDLLDDFDFEEYEYVLDDEEYALDLVEEPVVNTQRSQELLIAKGFHIPVLLIENQSRKRLNPEIPENFDLPLHNEDNYEEKTFDDFQRIVDRLFHRNETSDQYLRFKIDYRQIFRGITGKSF